MLDTHIIRLGTHAEKDYLLRAYAWFDEVMLNANLVQGAASSLSLFVTEIQKIGKTYFIDPVTYAFALSPNLLMRNQDQPPSRDNLKRTFRGLARRYGRVVDQNAGARALEPADFSSAESKEEFCQCVLAFQQQKLSEALEENIDFLLDQPTTPIEPSKLVAPYFHLSGDMDWLELNIDFAHRACQIDPQTWALVCLDSLLLDSTEMVGKIVTQYKTIPTRGYLVWATDFWEERATEGQIKGLRQLVSGLSQDGTKPVINVFGGYFSCLLTVDGLTGVSHGLGYGERRDIEPVLGGGLPPARYYLPAIHQHIRLDQFVSIASELDENSFPQQVCNCIICQGLMKQGLAFLVNQYTASEMKMYNDRYRQVAIPQVYRLTRFHYLSNKNLEFRQCHECSLSDLLDQLDEAYDRFRRQLGTSSLMYLRTWRRALSEL